MKKTAFKPVFDGYFKIYLHDDDYKKAADRAEFTGQWIKSRRNRIMKKDRKFQVTLHIFDMDGHKRGLQGMVFTSRGDQTSLSKVIFGFGNEFVDELRAGDDTLKVDLVNSYAVVRA
jgi:hypothetical protein